MRIRSAYVYEREKPTPMITIPYGTETLTASIDWATVLDTLSIGAAPAVRDIGATFLANLDSPIGQQALRQVLHPNGSVLIVVSDSFRKTAIHVLLPALIRYLNESDISDEDIAFLVATGTHRPPTAEEQAEILGGAMYDRFQSRIFCHDPDDDANLVHCGTTSRGTPVYINRRAMTADTVIATGTTVLHYFGGFGGGRKSIVPGIAGRKTIAANHALNLDLHENRLNPDVSIGRLDGNPVAEDMLEGSRYCNVNFMINTVLNQDGDIAQVFCGDLEVAHRAACAYAETLYAVPIREKADFVIASAGNAKNFIQSHKTLYNAFQVVKRGGPIVLATPAPEGYGGNKFEAWLRLGTPDAIIAELRKHAEINGQTALSTREKARNAILLTAMSSEDVQGLGAVKARDLTEALDRVRGMLDLAGGHRPTCYLMPDGAYTVPFYRP